MVKDLYLTADEVKIWKKLPASLREGWEVLEETQDCYETLRQIKMRYCLADFTTHPGVKAIAEKVANGEGPEEVSLEDFGEDALDELFFVIGARGVKAMILDIMNAGLNDDADVELIAMLSHVRHKLLDLNCTPVA